MKKRTRKLSKVQRENLALEMFNRLLAPQLESVYDQSKGIMLKRIERRKNSWWSGPETVFGVLMP